MTPPHGQLASTLEAIAPADREAAAQARARQDRLTKPPGSMGLLEDLSVQLCAIACTCPAPVPQHGVVAIFAADHGVHAQGVSPWPQEVTAQMVLNFLSGGAVINAVAAQNGAEVVVVDIGVATEFDASPGLFTRKVRPGTADLSVEPAMTETDAIQAVEVGIAVAYDLIDDGAQVLITGDMGIANTTTSAALIAAMTRSSARAVTGRGTGIDEAMWQHKVAVIERALALHQPNPSEPIEVLRRVGGLEHAGLAGFMLGAAARRTPVLLDGVIAASAALIATAMHPAVQDYLIAGHQSVEPGAAYALRSLGLRPLLDLGMRLGEGSGAALALTLTQSAARVLAEAATFDSAGVTDKTTTDRR